MKTREHPRFSNALQDAIANEAAAPKRPLVGARLRRLKAALPSPQAQIIGVSLQRPACCWSLTCAALG